MKNCIAIIPARGGSKGIPKKNLTILNGLPLVAHSILHALNCKEINRTFVSTDDEEIEEVSKNFGAEVIKRPVGISGDFATSESALLHVLDFYRNENGQDPDLIVFLQPTSPLRKEDDISNCINLLIETKSDSIFSAAKI